MILLATQTINDVLVVIAMMPIMLYHLCANLVTLYYFEPYRRAAYAILRRYLFCPLLEVRSKRDSQSTIVSRRFSVAVHHLSINDAAM
jgi:hypothetical protein